MVGTGKLLLGGGPWKNEHAEKHFSAGLIKYVQTCPGKSDVRLQDAAWHVGRCAHVPMCQSRAEACRDKLQELNTAVAVSASSGELKEDFLSQFQVFA